MRFRPLTLLGLVAIFWQHGCGIQPGTTRAPAPVLAVPSALPMPQPQAGTNPDQARMVLGRAIAAFNAKPAFQARISFMQKQGSQLAEGIYALAGKRPKVIRIEVEKGTGAGTKLLWSGGDTVKVRPTGLFSAITVDLPQTDDRLMSIRGYTLAQTDMAAMYTYLGAHENQLTGPEQTADGLALRATGRGFPKGVISMTGVFDPVTLFPRKVEMRDSREVVLRFDIRDFQQKSDVALDI